jgi:UDP:flavonoid glycosyltransferase YjiC (YdhE family)
MEITILAVGTRGDIQPCVALAKELIKLDIDLLLATHKEYRDLVANNNIDFAELPENPAAKWNSEQNKKMKFSEQMEYYGRIWLEKSLEICSDTDAIVYTSLFFMGSHLAEKLKIPHFPVHFEPNIRTSAFPSPYLGTEKKYNGSVNKFTHNFAYYSFWFKIRKTVNKLRENILGLPHSPFVGYFGKKDLNSVNFLLCFSKYLVERPTDWNSNINISGYWFLKREENYIPDDELNSFFDNNKPIYFDFGSFAHDLLKPKVKTILNDLLESGEKLLLDPGKMDISDFNLTGDIKIIDGSVPHEWILPKVKIIITHGGVGAVHAAMKAGIPIIPVTMFPAQYFWGNRLFNLGLGSRPIRIRMLKKGEIIECINMIRSSKEMPQKLENIKNMITNERGAENTAKYISDSINK